VPSNSAGTAQCDNPNLLYWRATSISAARLRRTRRGLWRVQPLQDRQGVSGISQSVATDIGIFDNYTAKTTWKPSQNNTFIGYFQQGRKQKPKRGLSTVLPPASVLAQDSYSRMGKGEWQRVITSRAFLDVNIGSFYLGWPMKRRSIRHESAAAVPRQRITRRRRLARVLDGAAQASDEGADDVLRTGQGRQPRPEVRLRDFVRLVPVRPTTASRARSGTPTPERTRHGRPIGSSSSTQAWRPTMATRGRLAPTWTCTTRATAGSLVADAAGHHLGGLRIDYQRVGYGDAIRTPQIHDQIPSRLDPACSSGAPASSSPPARRSPDRLPQSYESGAASRRQLRPDR